MDTNWKKVPVEPTEEMLNEIHLVHEYSRTAIKARYKAMIAAAPEYKPRHSLEEDFQHFLAYQNWLGLSDDEIARLRIAYEHGASRGE